MMFMVNSGVAVGLLPIVLAGKGTITEVLGYWSIAAIAVCAWSHWSAKRLARNWAPISAKPSYMEGLFTIPAIIGPWVLIFLVRFNLASALDPAALSTFSISSMVAEMAFLISVSIIGTHSNRILGGEHPNRALALAIPIMVACVALGLLGLSVLLPHVAREGYSFSVSATIILAGAGIVRLYISAWLLPALAARVAHTSAWSYIVVSAAIGGILALLQPTSMDVYGLAILAGFVITAAYLRLTVHRLPVGNSVVSGTDAPLV
jgi:hypothetical protein